MEIGIPRERLAGYADAFFAWWFSELRGIAPKALGRMLDRARGHAVLDVDLNANRVVVRRQGWDGQALLETIALAADQSVVALHDVTGILIRHRLARRRVRLRIDPGVVLRRQVTVPSTARRYMRPLLGFEVDRQTPFRQEQVWFDFRVASSSGRGRPVPVELFLVERETLSPLLEACARAGIEVAHLGVISTDPALAGIDFLRGSGVTGTSVRFDHMRLPAALIAALAVGLVLAREDRVSRTDALLNERVAVARRDIAAMAELRKSVEAATATLAVIPRQRHADHAAAVLAELARRLPDDSYLTDLSLHGSSVEVRGVSMRASDLIRLIGASPEFRNPRFTAPVTEGGRPGTQQFAIGFDLKPDTAP